MLRHALSLALPAAAVLLLAACGQEAAAPAAPRPALVVQPQPAEAAADSYPGEVRARFEPELAFRIGGKVSQRRVEEGQRVKAEQPLAELDPQDVRLQLEANRAQMAAAEPTCHWCVPSVTATRSCWSGRWSATPSTTMPKTSTVLAWPA